VEAPPPVFDGLAPPEPAPEPPPELALLEPELALPEDPLEDELVGVVLVVVVEVVVVEGEGVFATVEVGTVSGGAPEVSAAVVAPPPQAASVPESASAAHSRASFLITDRLFPSWREPSARKRLHPPAAGRAVVQVLLRQLVTPVAEPQVLDRPGQLGRGGGQREQHSHDLELLVGLAIHVDPVGLRFDDDLSAGGGRPHAVLLARPHSMPSYRSLG
jgi:hypothetical protein